MSRRTRESRGEQGRAKNSTSSDPAVRECTLHAAAAQMRSILHSFTWAMSGCANTGDAHRDLAKKLQWLDKVQARALVVLARSEG